MILREVLKARIDNATVTETQLNYKGSIGIDKTFLAESGISPGERVQVSNVTNGAIFETYVIEEKPNSATIKLYGPAAKRGKAGDKVSIISYVLIGGKELGRIKVKAVSVDK